MLPYDASAITSVEPCKHQACGVSGIWRCDGYARAGCTRFCGPKGTGCHPPHALTLALSFAGSCPNTTKHEFIVTVSSSKHLGGMIQSDIDRGRWATWR